MKKLFITLLLSLGICTSAIAQQTEHQVRRGETFASIATRYGITEDALRKANADKKTAYAGVKLKIPVVKTTSEKVIADTSVPTSEPTVRPSAPTTEHNGNSFSMVNFNKGKEYFYNKKWKKAIKAFNDVLSDPLADNNTKLQSQKFLAQAQKQQQERKQRREAIWNGISTGLKAFGNILTETSNTLQEQENRRREVSNRQNQMSTQTVSNQQDVDDYRSTEYSEVTDMSQDIDSDVQMDTDKAKQLTQDEQEKLQRLKIKHDQYKKMWVTESHKAVQAANRGYLTGNGATADRMFDKCLEYSDKMWDTNMEIYILVHKPNAKQRENESRRIEKKKKEYREKMEKSKLGFWKNSRGKKIISHYSHCSQEIYSIKIHSASYRNLSVEDKRNIIKRNQQKMKELRAEYKNRTGEDLVIANNERENWSPRNVDLIGD